MRLGTIRVYDSAPSCAEIESEFPRLYEAIMRDDEGKQMPTAHAWCELMELLERERRVVREQMAQSVCNALMWATSNPESKRR